MAPSKHPVSLISIINPLLKIVTQIFLPYKSLYDPIESMLNAADATKQEKMLTDWKEQMTFELKSIMLAATLLGSVIASALAWPIAIQWSVRALWLTSLLLTLISLSLAAQQSIALKRTVCAEFAVLKLKYLLGEPVSSPSGSQDKDANVDVEKLAPDREVGKELEAWQPLMLQLYIWQIPSMLLGNSILLFVVGLAVYVFATARAAGWGDEGKIAVFFGSFVLFVAAHYLVSWNGIERRVKLGTDEAKKKKRKCGETKDAEGVTKAK